MVYHSLIIIGSYSNPSTVIGRFSQSTWERSKNKNKIALRQVYNISEQIFLKKILDAPILIARLKQFYNKTQFTPAKMIKTITQKCHRK